MKDLPADSWKASLMPEVNVDPRKKWGILNTMKVSYKHSESAYWKASNEVMISSKYYNRYRNIGDIGNFIIPKCQKQD